MAEETTVSGQGPAALRAEVEDTRAGLADKLETLEQGIKDTWEGAKASLAETVESVQASVETTAQAVQGAVHDTSEAVTQAQTSPPEEVYDGLLMPALNHAQRDRERDDLTEADEQFILRVTREVVADLGERQAAAAGVPGEPAGSGTQAPAPPRIRVLGCPGGDEADRLALEMLRQLLDPARWEVEVLSTEMLSAELVALAGEKEPAVLCIGAVPPGGLARARYLCKRLRARLPGAKIVVGRWGLRSNVEENQEQLLKAGADQVETTLLGTREHLNAWLPVLAEVEAKAAQDGGGKGQERMAI